MAERRNPVLQALENAIVNEEVSIEGIIQEVIDNVDPCPVFSRSPRIDSVIKLLELAKELYSTDAESWDM